MSKNKEQSNKAKKLVTGIAIGGAIGSILGLIFAPRKGKETRSIIKEKSQNIYQKGKILYKKKQQNKKKHNCFIMNLFKKKNKKQPTSETEE